MNILDKIAARAHERVAEKKKVTPLEKIREAAERINAARGFPFEGALRGGFPFEGALRGGFPFEGALRGGDISFICEIKKASPSKGVIADDFLYVHIAKEYVAAGAAAISVLAEPYYFQGDDVYLRDIADTVAISLLRKDFTVDSYMIYEAKTLGASAVLLICSILDSAKLNEFINIAHEIGLSALVETRDEREIETALTAGARIIGVNNRDLKTFEVDITTSERLRRYVPNDRLFVSESGIRTPGDIDRLRMIKADAVLIGEAFMRSPDKKAELAALRGGTV